MLRRPPERKAAYRLTSLHSGKSARSHKADELDSWRVGGLNPWMGETKTAMSGLGDGILSLIDRIAGAPWPFVLPLQRTTAGFTERRVAAPFAAADRC
jgi:hypothetical protein